jgi:cold shock CspA family protein
MHGKIKKLFTKRGFGFIKAQHGYDIFFHHTVVVDRSFDNLAIGQKVEYSSDPGAAKGPRATVVTPI